MNAAFIARSRLALRPRRTTTAPKQRVAGKIAFDDGAALRQRRIFSTGTTRNDKT
jgi:hypothetical protein